MADYKVKLVRAASITKGGAQANGPSSITQGNTTVAQRNSTREQVVFEVTPTFSEGRTVNYKNIDPIHAPGAIYMFANTNARTFNITGKFISRSVEEATKTQAYIQYLRTWCMPVFGTVGANPAPGEGILGAPPAVLLLTAYSKGALSQTQTSNTVPGPNGTTIPAIGNNIYNVPVIITNLDIPYPDDVDYIPTINQIPVPTVVTVTISLVEAHSPNAYSKFSLQDYKTGNLTNF